MEPDSRGISISPPYYEISDYHQRFLWKCPEILVFFRKEKNGNRKMRPFVLPSVMQDHYYCPSESYFSTTCKSVVSISHFNSSLREIPECSLALCKE